MLTSECCGDRAAEDRHDGALFVKNRLSVLEMGWKRKVVAPIPRLSKRVAGSREAISQSHT